MQEFELVIRNIFSPKKIIVDLFWEVFCSLIVATIAAAAVFVSFYKMTHFDANKRMCFQIETIPLKTFMLCVFNQIFMYIWVDKEIFFGSANEYLQCQIFNYMQTCEK